jgi:hypothetical protein
VAAARASRATAKRSSTSARACGVQLAQPCGLSNAVRAASTARSTSASEASGTEPMISSVEGETTVIVSLPAGATQSPSM